MTPKQHEIAAQVEELLREHFDAYLLTLHASDVNDKGASETSVGWFGGIMMGIGLASYSLHKLKIRAWNDMDESTTRPPGKDDEP